MVLVALLVGEPADDIAVPKVACGDTLAAVASSWRLSRSSRLSPRM